ncbi:MAG: hypothetical protein DRR04_14335 [Gammaproteobacteria bacterium]|nr:MAG: hypothetical protein DRR04_14335 [Gammaproteobacteria bacterium]
MQLMKDAGFGGVEINPIQMPESVKNPSGKPLTWLSREWIDILYHASTVSKKLGMTVDLIVGTGWPFGGEFLLPEETIQGIREQIIELEGPGTKRIELLPILKNSRIEQVKLFPSGASGPDDAIDLTDLATGQKSIDIKLSKGKYKLYILTWHHTFRTVFRGTKGGAGPVLNHFDKTAVEHYLNHISDQLNRYLPGGMGEHIRSMFCDSIELEGANWTGDLPVEFTKRKGYDLNPYLPLLLDDQPDISQQFKKELKRVRFDHRHLLAELLTERFILTFHNWCHENNTLSRYQAYGYPSIYTDMLNGYLIPDIPEGDQWLFNGGWQPCADIDKIRYAIFNKYASSAGHIRDRKIISSEAMTNTTGVFEASLEYVKQATDINFCSGINHLVLHGFNYSPPEAGFPGWIQFGTYFSEQNPWWSYVKHWTDYTGRLSHLFQESQPVSHVALLGPVADIWSNYGFDRNPLLMEPWYLHTLWQAFSHLGILSDYISEQVLLTAKVNDGKISIGKMNYQSIILCDVKTMAPETAAKIRELTDQGAKIIILGELPSLSPGLTNATNRDATVQTEISDAITAGLIRFPSPGKPEQASPDTLLGWTEQLTQKTGIRPDVIIHPLNSNLFYNQFTLKNTPLFFFANTSRENTLSFTVKFLHKNKSPWLWDAEKGTREQLRFDEDGILPLTLTPLATKLIVMDEKRSGEQAKIDLIPVKLIPKPIKVEDGWHLNMHPVDGDSYTLKLSELKDLSRIKKYENFAGTIDYSADFFIDDTSAIYLDPGIVKETAEIKINGQTAGLQWWGRDPVKVEGLLKTGTNRIEIKVTTLLFNLMRSRVDDPVASYWLGRSKTKSPLPTGLIGPVQLLYS